MNPKVLTHHHHVFHTFISHQSTLSVRTTIIEIVHRTSSKYGENQYIVRFLFRSRNRLFPCRRDWFLDPSVGDNWVFIFFPSLKTIQN